MRIAVVVFLIMVAAIAVAIMADQEERAACAALDGHIVTKGTTTSSGSYASISLCVSSDGRVLR